MQASALAQSLEAEGFNVRSSLDRATRDTLQAVEDFREDAAEADRVFVLLSGHMVPRRRGMPICSPVSPSAQAI